MIYLMVENRDRELWSRLLIAAALYKHGAHSVVGSQRVIAANMAAVPKGTMVFKGANRAMTRWALFAREYGHRIAVIDEECINVVDKRVMQREFCPGFPVDRVFCDGGLQAAVFPNAVATGNPRIDLLTRPELFGEAPKSGYVLVNTNSAGANCAGPVDEYAAMCLSAGVFDTFDQYRAHMRHDEAKIRAVRRFMEAYDGDVVLRPHPTEDPERWRRLYGDRVVTEGSHIAWIRNARAVVHTGCTTGIEAAYMGVPAFSILTGCPEDGVYATNRAPYRSGSVEDALEWVKSPKGWTTKPDGQAHERIADVLRAMFKGNHPVELEPVEVDPYFRAKAAATLEDVTSFCEAWGLNIPVREIGDSVFQVG